MKKDFLSILDISAGELFDLIRTARKLKEERKKGVLPAYLGQRTLGMIFEKSSTRTRLSFEVGMYELGGYALFLNAKDLQLGRGEAIRDTAQVMSRFISAIMIRSNAHQTIEDLASSAAIPVINGLSDREHPCQILADIMTIIEQFGRINGLKTAWIGDGNNVCNSLILSAIHTGMKIVVASPPAYQPPEDIVRTATSQGASIRVVSDPREAADDADVIMTDTWVSMGDEDQTAERETAFRTYQVNRELLSRARPGSIVMHCLPAHRGYEITDEILDGPQSVVWDEAENRLHVQKALLLKLLG